MAEFCDCGNTLTPPKNARGNHGNLYTCQQCQWLDGKTVQQAEIIHALNSGPNTLAGLCEVAGSKWPRSVLRSIRLLEQAGRVRSIADNDANDEKLYLLVGR